MAAFDPSARTSGASAFLVKAKAVRELLLSSGYALVFTVLGEKIVHGPSVQELDRLYVSGTYSYDGKSLKRINLTSRVNDDWSKAAAAKRHSGSRSQGRAFPL